MYSCKIAIVLAIAVAVTFADDSDHHHNGVFKQCADELGLKPNPERRKQFQEAREKGERPPMPSPEEIEKHNCVQKCFFEKLGLLSGSKIVIDEIKKDEHLVGNVAEDKLNAYMDCLKALEIKECSDVKKIFECRKSNS
ncbi:hypothetical protein HHI36_021174 [Cryptolaemus montrouzieri]|uniref:Uncharacterized protein n=1 Tax=Cryptolaemus montrouzieri TaxID=559131 RepID=A0ABD2MVY5_9CUCU